MKAETIVFENKKKNDAQADDNSKGGASEEIGSEESAQKPEESDKQ